MRKPVDYYSYCRMDLVTLADPQPHWRVLELGCGEGNTGGYLLENGLVREVVGVEIDPVAAEKARRRFSIVLVRDLEEPSLSFKDPFDLILCGDVLEHLKDPWRMVWRLKEWVKKGGLLVASLPNIRHREAVFPLFFRGQFDYQPAGILDRTHLRFFTRKSVISLFEEAGLRIETITHEPLTFSRQLRSWLTFGWAHDFYVYQFKVRAVKS